MKNANWETLFGHMPNLAMKTLVMEEVKSTGDDIRKVVSRYTLPEMAIIGPDGKFHDIKTGRRITPEEWHKSNPLGEYGRLIIVREADL